LDYPNLLSTAIINYQNIVDMCCTEGSFGMIAERYDHSRWEDAGK